MFLRTLFQKPIMLRAEHSTETIQAITGYRSVLLIIYGS